MLKVSFRYNVNKICVKDIKPKQLYMCLELHAQKTG